MIVKKCDYCGEVGDFDEMLTVITGTSQPQIRNTNFHFCNYMCLEIWAREEGKKCQVE